nr:MAG TPA: hypothetical protein [Caudoviricetes sp.]
MYIFLLCVGFSLQYFPTCNNYLLNFIYKQRIKHKIPKYLCFSVKQLQKNLLIIS